MGHRGEAVQDRDEAVFVELAAVPLADDVAHRIRDPVERDRVIGTVSGEPGKRRPAAAGPLHPVQRLAGRIDIAVLRQPERDEGPKIVGIALGQFRKAEPGACGRQRLGLGSAGPREDAGGRGEHFGAIRRGEIVGQVEQLIARGRHRFALEVRDLARGRETGDQRVLPVFGREPAQCCAGLLPETEPSRAQRDPAGEPRRAVLLLIRLRTCRGRCLAEQVQRLLAMRLRNRGRGHGHRQRRLCQGRFPELPQEVARQQGSTDAGQFPGQAARTAAGELGIGQAPATEIQETAEPEDVGMRPGGPVVEQRRQWLGRDR